MRRSLSLHGPVLSCWPAAGLLLPQLLAIEKGGRAGAHVGKGNHLEPRDCMASGEALDWRRAGLARMHRSPVKVVAAVDLVF